MFLKNDSKKIRRASHVDLTIAGYIFSLIVVAMFFGMGYLAAWDDKETYPQFIANFNDPRIIKTCLVSVLTFVATNGTCKMKVVKKIGKDELLRKKVFLCIQIVMLQVQFGLL